MKKTYLPVLMASMIFATPLFEACPSAGSGNGIQNLEKEVGGKVYKLVWEDDFTLAEDDGTPLLSNWNYDVGRGTQKCSDGARPKNYGWGNSELQWYSNQNPENTYVSDGTLKIKAKKIPVDAAHSNASWSSGRIVTRGKHTWKYGYFEMRAKIPNDRGVWPAFWMLNNDIYNGKKWPGSGEIDIMETSESVWDRPAGLTNGDSLVFGTIHCNAGSGGSPIFSKSSKLYDIEGQWHNYAVEWTEEYIAWYYDDQLQFKYKPYAYSNDPWPFNQEFYLIINLAVGGNLGGTIAGNLNESTMEIDYVRVWQLSDDKADSSGNSGSGDEPAKVEIDPNAVDWNSIPFAGDGAGGGSYSNKYKFYTDDPKTGLVNIQFPGFASEAGLYVTCPGDVFGASINDSSSGGYDKAGAGVILHLSKMTKKYNAVKISYSGGEAHCIVYNAAGN